MEWRGEGTVIARRPHGENGVILRVLSRDQGVVAGMVPGGASRKRAAMLQQGSRLALVWRARRDDQLGTFTPEPLRARSGILRDGDALAGLSSVCALLDWALPERDPHPALHDRTESLLDALDEGRDWHWTYLRWELALLEDLGLGLDLTGCAVTGDRDGLAYVSPRSGRAVSEVGAGEYAPRLLPLPALLWDNAAARGAGDNSGQGLIDGARLTGHFLDRQLAVELIGRPLPAARARLIERMTRGMRHGAEGHARS